MANKDTKNRRSVAGFGRQLQGRIVRPGDEDYDEVRTIRNALYQRRPTVIVQATSANDVIATVDFAREQDLALAVRSGAHSMSGHSSSDDIVLDLSAMKSIRIDPESRIARIEPGATWGEFSEAAQAYGLAVPSGDTSSVGVGGLTIGGGIGWLVRKHGLTIDHLLSAEVVTADGRLLRASARENPDLFWAIRGGGGNFGVVTSFEFRAVPVGMIVGGAIFYDAADGHNILRRYAQYASDAPDDLTTIVFIMHAPPLPYLPPEVHGRLIIAVGVCYVGDLGVGQRVVAPLRDLGTPLADVTGPMPYPAIYALTAEATTMGIYEDVRSMFLRELDDETIATILRHSNTMTSPFALSQLRVLGGAAARVLSGDTAFAHRDKAFMFTAINSWRDPGETHQQRLWTERFWQDLQPAADGVYMNFLSDEGEERIREAYDPTTYERLASLKARYDPTNFFHLNQNIKPAHRHEERSAA